MNKYCKGFLELRMTTVKIRMKQNYNKKRILRKYLLFGIS